MVLVFGLTTGCVIGLEGLAESVGAAADDEPPPPQADMRIAKPRLDKTRRQATIDEVFAFRLILMIEVDMLALLWNVDTL